MRKLIRAVRPTSRPDRNTDGHGRRTTAIVAFFCFCSMAIASVASAGPIHVYGELLTSDAAVGLPGNVRAQLDASFDPSAYDIVLDGSVSPGDGLGSGYIGRRGAITYSHYFSPSAAVDEILGASLLIGTADDGLFDGGESVEITLDGDFWASGWATFSVFGGTVSASLFEDDGEAVVSVSSRRGDVNLVASLFKVVYEAPDVPGDGGGIAAVPEPRAMMLFSAGLGVAGIVTRRRR